MPTIHDQIELERKYSELSAGSYYLKQDKLRESDRGDEVDSVRSIMRQRISEVGRSIDSISQRRAGVAGKYNALLRDVATFDGEVDFDVLAYVGIKIIFNVMGARTTGDWNTIAETLARRLEFEHKARKFQKLHPGYYFKLMQSMGDQQVSSYKHIRNVLARKMADFDMEWEDWDRNVRANIANKILLSILHRMEDVFFRSFRHQRIKTIATIETTPEADKWLAEFEAEKGFLSPTRVPTIIPPLDWVVTETGEVRGGYYSYRLATTLVKSRIAEHKKFISEHSMAEHIAAVNKMQATAWQINTRILEVQTAMFKENIEHPGIPAIKPYTVPDAPKELEGLDADTMTDEQKDMLGDWKLMAKSIHRADRARKGKVIQFRMAHNLAMQYRDYEEFHYVYTADFRGRLYAETVGLSPQSNDTSKALLQFAKGKPVGESGLFWLAVHGANKFGNDKISYEDRVRWVYDSRENVVRTTEDPIGNREWWGSADKPWQFLAFCYEWVRTGCGENPNVSSHLPVAFDGSCNGLQHYSALLRDSVGGASVNLTDSELPSDIYEDVSEQLRKTLLCLANDPNAKLWLSTGLGRKLTKRPVMTLPYGSTRNSARQYIYDWALDNRMKFPGMNEKDIWDACMWLTPHLWEAIGQVVIAARVGMDWIQHRVTKLTRTTEDAIKWVSPVGFPVYQPYFKQDMKRLETKTLGGIRIRLTLQEDTDEVCRTKQRSGIAPNFVHSLDSSHMVRVINGTDFDGYAMIHDDFGTHAADAGKLWQAIRDEFVLMYDGNDLLRAWSAQQGEYDGEYPEMGDLDVTAVSNSEYFFG